MPGLPVPTAPTVGEIARRIDQPIHRVEYVIRARGIRPTAIAGNARVFSEADVDRIAAEMRQIDVEKNSGRA